MKRTLALAGLFVGSAAAAQTAPRGWEVSALPATNFNSDEGFGYGITAQAYQYGNGSFLPYRYTIQPVVLFTTKGRRDVTVAFDAPHLLPRGWRMSGTVGREQQLATPYYGLGNSTAYDKGQEQPPNAYYYRYGRTAIRVGTDLQHSIKGPLRLLLGAGYLAEKIDKTPFDSGTTLAAQETGSKEAHTSTNTVRVGLVFDTRDRETGPSRGQWTEMLVQHSSRDFRRVTITARSYVPVSSRLVWAHRVVAQDVSGVTEFFEVTPIQGSFRDGEGLGGAGSVRGLPKNRYIGKGMLFANEELRFRAADFRVGSRPSALILSGFFDAGRVWESGLARAGDSFFKDVINPGRLFDGFHSGAGVGTRLAYGQNFVVALDGARSSEGTAIYIGLGYPF